MVTLLHFRVEADHGQGLPRMLEVNTGAQVAFGPAADDLNAKGFHHGTLRAGGLDDAFLRINFACR